MRSRWISGLTGAVVAFVAVALLGAGMAHSKGRGGSCGHGPGARLDRLEDKLADLDLDAATKSAAETVLEKARSEGEGRRDELRSARRTLHELVEQEQPDVAGVMAQVETVGALETADRKARLSTMLQLRALLTPEQWSELRPQRHRKGAPLEES